MKQLSALILLLVASAFSSCAVRNITIYCEPQSAAIHIDGQYYGNGIVRYEVPRGQREITVSCTADGVNFVERRIYTSECRTPISIYLNEYMRYSSNSQTLSTH